jgi:hypothetical protein
MERCLKSYRCILVSFHLITKRARPLAIASRPITADMGLTLIPYRLQPSFGRSRPSAENYIFLAIKLLRPEIAED